MNNRCVHVFLCSVMTAKLSALNHAINTHNKRACHHMEWKIIINNTKNTNAFLIISCHGKIIESSHSFVFVFSSNAFTSYRAAEPVWWSCCEMALVNQKSRWCACCLMCLSISARITYERPCKWIYLRMYRIHHSHTCTFVCTHTRTQTLLTLLRKEATAACAYTHQ